MKDKSVIHSTFVIERSYSSAPRRVFAAFSDPAKKRCWFAEGEESELEQFEMDFRVGGMERARFRTGNGLACRNDTVYLDIVPDRRMVIAYTMSVGDARISSSQSTIELLPAGQGTALVFTEQAAFFENADGPQMRQDGWNQLLDRLAKELAA